MAKSLAVACWEMISSTVGLFVCLSQSVGPRAIVVCGEIISLSWLGDVLLSPEEELLESGKEEEHLDPFAQAAAPAN